MFDVSHLGTVRVEGAGAFDTLQAPLTNDLGKIDPGRAQYTHLLDPADASVLDDIIVWWRDDEAFDVMPNASNTERVRAAIGGDDVTAGAGHHRRAGSRGAGGGWWRSRRRPLRSVASAWPPSLERRGLHRGRHRLHGRGRRRDRRARRGGGRLWRAILAAGMSPAGLGARDTLRLEAALPLHGHELGPGITPLQAGLGWVVSWTKPTFRGKDALAAERERGVHRLLRGLSTEGRRPPRAECVVLHRRRRGGGDHQRELLARPRPRHRAGLPPAHGRGRHGRRARPAGLGAGRPVVPTPFVSNA